MIRLHAIRTLVTTLAMASLASAAAIPGKYYEYYVVATTSGGSFTALGSGPAINNYGQVAFTGTTSIGQTIWLGDGNNNPAVDINPADGNPTPGREDYALQLQVNDNKEVVDQDNSDAGEIASQVRIWFGSSLNSYKYIIRGGTGKKFNGVLAYPATNHNGDGVAVVFNGVQKYLYLLTSTGTTAQVATSGSLPQPVIADTGAVLVTQNDTSSKAQLYLYQSAGFTNGIAIAGSNYFTSIDSAPGISANGNVVVFQGNLNAAGATAYNTNAGPGIFLAYQNGTAWTITRVTGLQKCTPACVPAPELGFNDANTAISFSSYPTGSRVAVTDLDLGGAGVLDDTVEIAFVATPSSASRTNPWIPNFPLLFSAQQGLWTIRVDFEAPLSVLNGAQTPHLTSAIPVVQIGDTVGPGNVITAIGVNGQIGNAYKDESGNLRTMRRGDHRIAFWASTAAGQQVIYRANHLDSDQDGLLDHWETTGIDMNQDGIIDLDLAAMGANPNKRDMFVELDWLAPQTNMNFAPVPGVITGLPHSGQTGGSLPTMYAAAPVLSGNLYGYRSDGAAPADIPAGITLHVDGGTGNSVNMGSGPLDGGQLVGMPGAANALVHVLYFGVDGSINVPGANARSFQNVKQNFLGSQDKDARELAFRYGVLAFDQGFADTTPAIHSVTAATINTITPADGLVPGIGIGDIVYILSGTGAGEINFLAGGNAAALTLTLNWVVIPDATSKFIYLVNSTGLAEVDIGPSPDFNSLAGNDFQLDASGVFGYTNPTMPCYQWRTMAHEMGHTLGLRHNGISNNPNKNPLYNSLMSYAYQLVCASGIDSYGSIAATATAPGFNDWASLQQNFNNSEFFLGDTGISLNGSSASEPETQTIQDYIAANGPIDNTPPKVTITAPAANTQIGLGGTLGISITATDNVSVANVRVSFDVNGDGTLGAGESENVTSAGGGVYHAQFKNISGAPGVRTIYVIATDPTGNNTTVSVNVSVVTANPAPVLASLAPPSTTHGGATFNLTVNGTGFISGCTGMWNGLARKTTFVSSTQIKMAVLNTDIANAGTAQITAANPAQGAAGSNALTFTIN